MKRKHSLAVLALPVLLGLGGAAFAIGGGEGTQSKGPLTCAIDVNPSGRMLEIEAVALADAAVSGSYSLEVRSAGSSGNSNVRQGGGFSLEAGKPATLGKVMLGGSAAYDVQLDIDANGVSITCDEQVRG
ncbi:hypothetical protein VE25_02880 [Devosia geojensis]|uniref:CsgH-like domain-containing protein n=1 Tax=Devosia geojensis TaxID=443610 RepID=A0A0F5FWP0_9HYPH|nr:curli-like amyloid fiber formation chaperone CsgH [Devosia geojensis]KKB13243.1 hypothetical protein VE25_02880 [Devosia geojensis]